MKINVNRDRLHGALQTVTSVVPARHTRPILQNLRIEPVEDAPNALDLVGTDLEVGVRHRLTVENVTDPAPAVLPAQRLAGVVREVRDEMIEIEISESEAVVTTTNGRFALVVVPSEDFPEVPGFSEEGATEIPGESFVDMVRHTGFAVATEQSRYAINGVYFQVEGTTAQMVATDGRRLARIVHELEKPGDLADPVIIPPKMLREIERHVSESEKGTVLLKREGNQILAQVDETTLVGRLVEGSFPKFQEVIPPASDTRVKMNREVLASRLRQAQLLTSSETMAVTLNMSPAELAIESRAAEVGEAKVRMDVDYNGDEMRIGFNPVYLGEVLKVLKTDEVEFEVTDSQRPGVFREGERYVYVIMPVSVRG